MYISISDYLNIEHIHDYFLTGILISDETTIDISISDISKKKIGSLVFSNVKSCKFDGFRLGNIIFDVIVYTGKDMETVVDECICYIYDIDKKKLTVPGYYSIKNDIFLQKLLLVNFSTSYGVYGAMLCENVKFHGI